MDIAKKIDHTMLKADASADIIRRYCKETVEHKFAPVCVNSCHVPLVSSQLKGSGVMTCCVVGSPLGVMLTSAKVLETSESVKADVEEMDMVINIGAVRDRNQDFVRGDIKAVVGASKPAIVKVIIKTCFLTDEEKVKACELSEEVGAAFVRTSTGFSTGGAAVEDIRLMRKTVGDRLQVKVSGGICTPEFVCELVETGANRIGAGNGIVLL